MAILVLLMIAVAAGYFGVARIAKSQIHEQLLKLDLGTPQIGTVSVSLDGIRADDITFSKTKTDDADDGEAPWLTVDQLIISHPLTKLAAVDDQYDAIEIVGAKARVDLPDNQAESDFEIDIAGLTLPASQLSVQDSQVALIDSDGDEFLVEGIELNLNQGDSTVNVNGSVNQLADASWTIEGSLQPDQNKFQLTLDSDRIDLEADDLKSFPIVKDFVPQWLKLDGVFSPKVVFSSSTAESSLPIDVRGDVGITEANIDIGFLDLSLAVTDGSINFDGNSAKISSIEGTLNDEASVTADVDLRFGQTPIVASYAADYSGFDVTTLQSIIPDFPTNVQGIAAGQVTGKVSVEDTLRTTASLETNPTVSNGRYGAITAKNMKAAIKVSKLIFDQNQNFDAIAGFVSINGTTDRQPVKNIFETFELSALQDQLALSGDGIGKVNIRLPLETVDQIKSWSVEVDANMPSASLLSGSIVDASSIATLQDGIFKMPNIRFMPVAASADAGNASGVVTANLEWPIDAPQANRDGKILLNGTNVNANWIRDAVKDQASRFSDTNPLESANLADKQLSGDINFDADIAINPNSIDSVEGWTVTANVKNANIASETAKLSNLNFAAELRDSVVNLKTARAKIATRDETSSTPSGGISASGTWSLRNATGQGNAKWSGLSFALLSDLLKTDSIAANGLTSGNVDLSNVNGRPSVDGKVRIDDVEFGELRIDALSAKIKGDDTSITVSDVQSLPAIKGLNVAGKVNLASPIGFDVKATANAIRLSTLLDSELLQLEDRSLVTGLINGEVSVAGDFSPFHWRTQGTIALVGVTANDTTLDPITAKWKHNSKDWKPTKFVAKAFGGSLTIKELTQAPQRVRVDFESIDAKQLTSLVELPVLLTGKLDGDAMLNDWDIEDTRKATVNLRGSSLLFDRTSLGDFKAKAVMQKGELTYNVDGTLIGGKLSAKGSTNIDVAATETIKFPLELNLRNSSLAALYRESNVFRSLRPVSGLLEAKADAVFDLAGNVSVDGRMGVNDLRWRRELLTRVASIHFNVKEGQLVFDDIDADLDYGSIRAEARIPLNGKASGDYRIDIEQISLQRIAEVMHLESLEAAGFADMKIGGKIGSTIYGKGYVGVDKASLHNVSGQSMRLPAQIQFSPFSQSGKVELRRSRFRLFNGNVTGEASIDFGRSFNVDVDLDFANVNSGDLISSVADMDLNQGRLNGRLKLEGRAIRSTRDLSGQFQGTLDRVAAFELPVLDSIGNALTGLNPAAGNYSSETIKLILNRGKIDIKSLNFANSLATVTVTGAAFLDGRLDLGVVARVERLNQPTLLDELVGSPLARLGGSPAAYVAQAAEFLSERVVFLTVGGTFVRPAVRIDSPQQLREEVVRYFLRSSGIRSAASN